MVRGARGWRRPVVAPAAGRAPVTDCLLVTKQRWGRTLFAVYGPTLMASIGFGAVIPLVAIQARALGASVGLAAFITALNALAQVMGDLPAGIVADRLGEKYAIVAACLIDTCTMAMVFVARSLIVLAIAVFLQGLTAAVFSLARQTYITERIPVHWRARAMSTLGGVFRIGWFIGPLAAAAVITRWDLITAFCFAGAMSFLAAVVTLAMPSLPGEPTGLRGIRQRQQEDHPATFDILRQHRHVLLTLGVGCLCLMLIRSVRQTIIPLWCEAHGISPAATSLIYSISMGFDVLLFFPGGWIMDRFGRWFVSVPTIAVMSLCLLALPLSHTAGTIALVACLLGFGNGVSSGIVNTLGADMSPSYGRPQFLAGWRVFGDGGAALGPLIVSAATALVSLPFASILVGAIGLAGTGWLARYVPREVVPDEAEVTVGAGGGPGPEPSGDASTRG